MYLDHFGLARKPFLISPDPDFLYPSRGHREALAHLHYGLEREGGFMLLTGEVGTGKTTLCRRLIEQLPDRFRLAYILNARLDSREVLAAICRELEIDTGEGDAGVNQSVERIYDNLLQAHADNRQTLVVIEEAQNLGADVLETLRLLTNLETATHKLLHILLIGQPELLDHLARPGLRQLNQRVVSRFHLGALTRRDVRHYLDYRVSRAGGKPPLFTTAAVSRIARRTGGIPRLINLLAEHSLVGAYAEGRKRVTAAVVRRAAPEVFGGRARPARSGPPWAPAALGGLLLAAAGALGWWTQIDAPGAAGPVESRTVEKARAGSPATGEPVGAPSPGQASASGEPPAAPRHGAKTRTAATSQGTPPAASTPSVFARWLQHWGVESEAGSVSDACKLAGDQGLRCDTLTGLSPDRVRTIDRPLLVTLRNDAEGLDYYVVNALGPGGFRLENSRDQVTLSAERLEQRWDGTARLLWRPPPGSESGEPLWPGNHAPELVDYLVEQLRAGGYLEGSLITGGTYNDYLSQRVRRFQRDQGLDVDGILGRMTLLRLNTLSRDVPTLAGAVE